MCREVTYRGQKRFLSINICVCTETIPMCGGISVDNQLLNIWVQDSFVFLPLEWVLNCACYLQPTY